MPAASLTSEPSLLAQVADMHGRELPGSLLTRAGSASLRGTYRYAARSGQEAVFVAREAGGALVGAALLSREPVTLSRRLLLHTRLSASLLARPRLSAEILIAEARSSRTGWDPAAGLPEIIAIFVDRQLRGQGVGRDLLAAVEQYLGDRSSRSYVIRTEDHPGNRAIEFYRSSGFADLGTASNYGTMYRVMRKDL